jgi:hypothetical protein
MTPGAFGRKAMVDHPAQASGTVERGRRSGREGRQRAQNPSLVLEGVGEQRFQRFQRLAGGAALGRRRLITHGALYSLSAGNP